MKMVVTTNWRSNATIAARSLVCFVTATMVADCSSSPQPPPLDYLPTGGHAVLPATFGAWYLAGTMFRLVRCQDPNTNSDARINHLVDKSGWRWVYDKIADADRHECTVAAQRRCGQ